MNPYCSHRTTALSRRDAMSFGTPDSVLSLVPFEAGFARGIGARRKLAPCWGGLMRDVDRLGAHESYFADVTFFAAACACRSFSLERWRSSSAALAQPDRQFCTISHVRWLTFRHVSSIGHARQRIEHRAIHRRQSLQRLGIFLIAELLARSADRPQRQQKITNEFKVLKPLLFRFIEFRTPSGHLATSAMCLKLHARADAQILC